jgi:hypothetical protein
VIIKLNSISAAENIYLPSSSITRNSRIDLKLNFVKLVIKPLKKIKLTSVKLLCNNLAIAKNNNLLCTKVLLLLMNKRKQGF